MTVPCEMQKQADAVLRESGLLDVLTPLGTVRFAGSYRLGLMVRPDIDIIVAAEAPSRGEAVKITKRLLDDGYFQSVVFIDNLSWSERLDAQMAAVGFYWHLDAPRCGRQWKCDVWYLNPEEDIFVSQTKRFEELLTANPEARSTILDLKREFLEGKGYRHGATGTRICKAVLEHGVTTGAELMKFLGEARDQ
ncbi:MAG: hypothetical protein GY851_01730 [bacterium]|nr:hypothetical protein [bacterium]